MVVAFALQLLVIAENEIDLGHRGVCVRRDLRGAAGDDEPRSGMRAPRAADRLARLALGLLGDGTSVDDDRVIESGGGGVAADDFGFERVQAATESQNLRRHRLSLTGWDRGCPESWWRPG